MYVTKVLLDDLYAQTEQFLEKAVQKWQNMPIETLHKKPNPSAWSAAQCLEHLNIYGRYYLSAIEKAIETAEKNGYTANETFKSGWLGKYFYNLMLPNTEGVVKSKMKAPAHAVPSERPDARAMIAEFIDQQERMLQLIERARKVNIAKVRVPISIMQWLKLKLGDTFLFMTAHHQRHILQAERSFC
ncbi:MAG: DinB family protein [Saprospiraceae bacterium]|nr:DinB family protein [Saprospiraceae bacterium]